MDAMGDVARLVEALEADKGVLKVRSQELERRCIALEKERDDAREDYQSERRTAIERAEEIDVLQKQLAQRRDLTLTADVEKVLTRAIEAMESAWHELAPGKSVIGDQFIQQFDMRDRINEVQDFLERWSREGKVEPSYRERSILTAKSAHQHLGAYNAACAACQAEDKLLPKPPAPGLAALRKTAIEKTLNVSSLMGWIPGAQIVDALRTLWLADIDAKLAARGANHGDR